MTSTTSEREKTEETATWKSSSCCYFKLELNKNYTFLEMLNNTDESDQPFGD